MNSYTFQCTRLQFRKERERQLLDFHRQLSEAETRDLQSHDAAHAGYVAALKDRTAALLRREGRHAA